MDMGEGEAWVFRLEGGKGEWGGGVGGGLDGRWRMFDGVGEALVRRG